VKMGEHIVTKILADELYRIYCPYEQTNMPLKKKPNFCPMCGKKLGDEK